MSISNIKFQGSPALMRAAMKHMKIDIAKNDDGTFTASSNNGKYTATGLTEIAAIGVLRRSLEEKVNKGDFSDLNRPMM